MDIKVIGCGAAGNKAVDLLVKDGFDVDRCCFVNSTPKDIPEEYKSHSFVFGKQRKGGCGKERTLGKSLILNDMRNGDFNIDPFITNGECDLIILVSSTEGGSGSASLPILAKYIKQVHKLPVICVLFFGFGDDPRGYQNSLEICQELDENYGIIFIQNSRYIEEAGGNKIKAEQKANKQFIDTIKALVGVGIYSSFQNIDDTDILKVVTTPGFMTVDQFAIGKYKNTAQYNEAINSYLDETNVVEAGKKSAKRIAVFFSTSIDNSGVDFSGNVFEKRFGVPYEFFTHIQDPKEIAFIRWIVAGQKLPIDDIKNIYESYQKASSSVDKNKDDFFDTMAKLKGNADDNMFNMMTSDSDDTESLDRLKGDFFGEFFEEMVEENHQKNKKVLEENY